MKSFISKTGIWGLVGIGMLSVITVLSVVFNMVFPLRGIDPAAFLGTLRATAATTAGVAATVTAQQVSVTITTDGSVAFGTNALGSTESTTPGELNDVEIVRNDGNITEIVNIRGANTAAWTLVSGTPTGEQYRLNFATSPVNWTFTALTTSNQTMVANLAASTNSSLALQITLSSNTTQSAAQTANVTVQATQ